MNILFFIISSFLSFNVFALICPDGASVDDVAYCDYSLSLNSVCYQSTSSMENSGNFFVYCDEYNLDFIKAGQQTSFSKLYISDFEYILLIGSSDWKIRNFSPCNGSESCLGLCTGYNESILFFKDCPLLDNTDNTIIDIINKVLDQNPNEVD